MCLRERPLPDQARGLEPVHVGHVDVEQDDRELLLQQAAQRLARRADADDAQVGRLENGLERHQVLPGVVDDEDADGVHV